MPASVSVGAVALRLANAEPNRAAQPPTPAVDPAQLAERYAPYLRLDSNEKLIPISREGYVIQTDLYLLYDRRHRRDIRRLRDPFPSVESLPTDPLPCPQVFRECHYYLKVDGRQPRAGVRSYLPLQQAILLRERPTVYWHFDQHERTMQYWFLYVFNYFANWHESDWEQVTLQLDSSLNPLRAGYSSHLGGQSKLWAEIEPGRGRLVDHVLVFVARGSHANYFAPVFHDVPECRKYFCKDRSDGLGRILAPADYVLTPLEGPVFSGDYGSGNFIAKGLKRVGTGINVSDPQAGRKVWTHPTEWLAGTRPADDLLGSATEPSRQTTTEGG